MESSSSSSFSTFSLLMTVLVAVILAKCIPVFYRQMYYWRKKGVPRMKVLLAIGTGWKVLFKMKSIPEFTIEVYNAFDYSRYVGMMDFGTPVLMIRDPEVIKEVAVKSFDNFMDHQGFVNEEMDPLFGKNIFSLKGDRWRDMRATLSPSFTASKMKFMFELVSKCSRDFVAYLTEHPEYAASIELKDLCSRYTNDVIATVAFGISVNSLENRRNEFFLRGKDASNFNSVWRLMKFILFRLNPRLLRYMGITFLSQETSEFFINVVSETVRVRDEQGIVRPDMIHLLMQARGRENGVNRMNIDDIVAQAFIFFLAGFDTSSTMMCCLLHELAVNQKIQDRLREEVDQALAEGNGEIGYDALSKLEYMDMVVSETLRKYPPVGLVDRTTINRFELPPAVPGGQPVVVEPRDIVWFPVHALHHDPKYFPEPENFDPERFTEENKEKIDPYVYMPFGAGPRKCIGNRFALMEIKILIAHLLEKFVVRRTEKTKHPIQFDKGSISPLAKGGFWVGLEKREK